MAHPPGNRHRPTTETRRMVRDMAKHGGSEALIAVALSARLRKQKTISRDTLRRHYADELEQGRAEGIMAVESTLLARATGSDDRPPDMAAIKFWLERRVPERWREQPKQVEIGRANEFDHLSDEELEAEVLQLEQLILNSIAAREARTLAGPPENDSAPTIVVDVEPNPAPCAAGMPARA